MTAALDKAESADEKASIGAGAMHATFMGVRQRCTGYCRRRYGSIVRRLPTPACLLWRRRHEHGQLGQRDDAGYVMHILGCNPVAPYRFGRAMRQSLSLKGSAAPDPVSAVRCRNNTERRTISAFLQDVDRRPGA